jgi:hypothetical protein
VREALARGDAESERILKEVFDDALCPAGERSVYAKEMHQQLAQAFLPGGRPSTPVHQRTDEAARLAGCLRVK